MEKKVFKKTQDVLIQKNIFDKLNEHIEKYCINSKVLFLVEPYLYQKYNKEILETKKYSLNNINVLIMKNSGANFFQHVLNLLNETFSLIVVLGDENTFNFAKKITIINNINTIFLCENIVSKQVFSPYFCENDKNKLVFKHSLPASLVVFKQQNSTKKNMINFLSYFSELIFYDVENFFSSIFFDNKIISFYYDEKNSLLNNYIINELNFQKQNINFNLIDELIFYSKIKNSVENRVLINIMLLSLYRGFIEKISFNNFGFNSYSLSKSFLKNFENEALFNYYNKIMPDREKVCYQLFTVKKILLSKVDKCLKEIKKYCGYMKLYDGEKFKNLKEHYNYEKIMNGIKLTAKLTENNTFLKIIDNFGFLN